MHVFRQPHSRWMQHNRWAWGFVLGCLMLTGVATAQSTPSPVAPALAPGTFRLTVTDSVLSLEANAASLAAICTAIDQQTGIEIVLYHSAVQTLTTHLAHVPWRGAFKRLAPNVVMVDAQEPLVPSHRIAKVYILQAGQAGASQPVAEEATSPVPPMSQGTPMPQAVMRPKPFTFTFDPLQPGKQPQ